MPDDNTFTLTIEMGDDSMQTSDDVANALHHTADLVAAGYTSGVVVDGNGNRVGRWTLGETNA